YDNGYGKAAVTHHYFEEYDTKKPTRDLTQNDDKQPLLWAGPASVYFNAIVRPEPLDPKQASPKYITSVTSATTNGDSPPNDRHVALLFTTDDLAVEPGKPLTIASSAYLGPRWRAV